MSLLFPGHYSGSLPISGTQEAARLGLTNAVIDSSPLLSDISLDGVTGPSQWYNGQFWLNPQPDPSLYTSFNGDPALPLCVNAGGSMGTANRQMATTTCPALPGSKSFYTEFTVQLSDQNLDYIPACWLMPTEHAHQNDHYPDLNPTPGYEYWQEIDVYEGGRVGYPGFKPGCIAWQGIFPGYTKTQTGFGFNAPLVDQTLVHTYAMSWDEPSGTVRFYFDNIMMYSTSSLGISTVIRRQNFFLIISAVKGALALPYYIKVIRVRALVAPT